MTSRRATWIWVATIVLGIVALFWLWPGKNAPTRPAAAAARPAPVARAVEPPPPAPAPVAPVAAGDPPSRIADALNAPGGNARRDLEIVSELFVAWQSNFPREGNPVGENAEITAALTGSNRLGFVFIPRQHPAINSAGELCDRWGTPLRLHQVSGSLMEIRSAGPDRKLGTGDDLNWPPELR